MKRIGALSLVLVLGIAPVARADDSEPVEASGASVSEDAEDGRAFGIDVSVTHSVGTGTFAANEYIRESYDYVAQSWNLQPWYKFDLLGHSLKASVHLMGDIELTTPSTNPARRLTPYDTSIGLRDNQVYKDEWTGINLSATLRYFVPTSYESLNVTRRWGGVQGSLTASRSLGPVNLSYTFSLGKNFNSARVAVAHKSVTRSSDPLLSQGSSGAAQVEAGYPNVSFFVRNTLNLGYQVTENLSVSYSVMLWQTFKYGLEQTDARDQFTSVNADSGLARGLDFLLPSLEISCQVNDLVEDLVQIPFALSLAGGLSAMHPAQTPDNEGIIWPLFYQAFAENRAANNYGNVYLTLSGSY